MASLVCLVIALTIKEDVWLYALGLALTQIDRVKRPLILTTAAITIVYFIVGTQWLWPWLYPHRQDVFLQCFAQADTKVGVALYLLQHPFSTAAKLWTGPGLGFFSTILFLPFLAPLRSLCLLPMTYLWLNSTSPERSALAFNNGVPTLVLFSAILPFGLRALERAWRARRGG